jgi:hypothetical protein
MAEPGKPDSNEVYSTDNEEWFAQAVHGPDRAAPFGTTHQGRTFKQRLEWFLRECGFDLKNHVSTYSQIVISNTFWLTLPELFEDPPKELKDYFLHTYLRPMLSCFTNATIVGAGGKAHKRLKYINVSYEKIGALSPAGCNQFKIVERQKAVARKIRNSFVESNLASSED